MYQKFIFHLYQDFEVINPWIMFSTDYLITRCGIPPKCGKFVVHHEQHRVRSQWRWELFKVIQFCVVGI